MRVIFEVNIDRARDDHWTLAEAEAKQLMKAQDMAMCLSAIVRWAGNHPDPLLGEEVANLLLDEGINLDELLP